METRDCINIIIDFINSKYGMLYNSKYKKLHVYNYCISMCDDSIDSMKIMMIVDSTIDYLLEHDYIIKFKHAFMTRKIIDYSLNIDVDLKSNYNYKTNLKKIHNFILKF